LLLAAGLTTVFLYSVIPAMVHQFGALVHDFPGYVANLQGRSARFRELTDRFHLTGRSRTCWPACPAGSEAGCSGSPAACSGRCSPR
jgi:hypothetical protein